MEYFEKEALIARKSELEKHIDFLNSRYPCSRMKAEIVEIIKDRIAEIDREIVHVLSKLEKGRKGE